MQKINFIGLTLQKKDQRGTARFLRSKIFRVRWTRIRARFTCLKGLRISKEIAVGCSKYSPRGHSMGYPISRLVIKASSAFENNSRTKPNQGWTFSIILKILTKWCLTPSQPTNNSYNTMFQPCSQRTHPNKTCSPRKWPTSYSTAYLKSNL